MLGLGFIYYIGVMVIVDKLENAEWLEDFNSNTWADYSFNLYSTLNSDEQIEEFWERCSEFYFLSVFPYDSEVEKWKDVPELYEIINRLIHWAEWHSLEILIWRYSEETMELARQKTEEKRKEFEEEWLNFITIRDPYLYVYMVWYFWGSAWRTAQYVIRELKNKFPEKFREIKHK